MPHSWSHTQLLDPAVCSGCGTGSCTGQAWGVLPHVLPHVPCRAMPYRVPHHGTPRTGLLCLEGASLRRRLICACPPTGLHALLPCLTRPGQGADPNPSAPHSSLSADLTDHLPLGIAPLVPLLPSLLAAGRSPSGKLVVDIEKYQPMCRLGGNTYGRTTGLFDLPRPDRGPAQQPLSYTSTTS